ncbi:MAG: glycosyltransferase family 2 protein [Bacteroidales bacterium]|nr:glycosyltransferase family 2 protein [Bacteroidales bacterium]
MISVCIPVYNTNVVPLARQLAQQAGSVEERIELVFIDDCSTEEYIEANTSLAELGKYIQLDENVGRAKIRNLFLAHAEGEYLIFLDNDMRLKDADFLRRYAEAAAKGVAVAVGGVCYDKRFRDKTHALRYMYGTQAESRDAATRAKDPYRSFMTGNFMVRRDVLEQHPFDETLKGYGHEDTLFGYSLKCNNIDILHIDNAAMIDNVETNIEYLEKSRHAVENLAKIHSRMYDNKDFCRSVRLITVWQTLKRYSLTPLVYALYRILRRPMVSHFEAGEAISVTQFNFYKLGLFIEYKKKAIKY